MMKKIFVVCLVCSLSGCSAVKETAKTVWGSSTRPLEKARVDAFKRTYQCTFDQCFDAILSLARPEEKAAVYAPDGSQEQVEAISNEYLKSGTFDVFIKDRIQSHIVVMGVVGNVNTTEVGIFFTEMSRDIVKIDISSLSTSAKEKVAQAVFDKLSKDFKEVK